MNLQEIELKINKFEDIKKIVLSMKSVASMNVQSSQHYIENVRFYGEKVAEAISDMLGYFPQLILPFRKGKTCTVVFGSDQGLCGLFNNKVAEKVKGFAGDELFIVIGKKLKEVFPFKPFKSFKSPISFDSIYSSASELISVISELFISEEIAKVNLVYNEFRGIGSYEPVERGVIPFEVERKRIFEFPPIVDMKPEQILSNLIIEYIYVHIYRAYLESFLSENSVRLMNMNNASRSIDKKLEFLNIERNYYRQEMITGEIEDSISSYKTLVKKGS